MHDRGAPAVARQVPNADVVSPPVVTGARMVTLVLTTSGGAVLGALPPFPVPSPWWQEMGAVVEEARRVHGLDVTILRILDGERDRPPGGAVTYLAEAPPAPATTPPPMVPWPDTVEDHPLRLPWARPGGPAADIAWAADELGRTGRALVGAPQQIRSWNLSSIWRLPVAGGAIWLKCVPPFFAHEGRMLEFLTAYRVPRLIAHEDSRILTEEVPGDDLYDASGQLLDEMVSLLIDLQARMVGQLRDLHGLGLPDWRATPLRLAIDSVIERTQADLDDDDAAVLEAFQAGLAGRFAALADCGLPDTLVHGDFHRGNLRGDTSSLTLLDWGDCGIGHPLLDQAAFLDRVPGNQVPHVREHWHARWRRVIPGSDPDRAARLVRPIAAARQAVIYRGFLDRIEPSEHPYHRADPEEWLRRTADIIRSEST